MVAGCGPGQRVAGQVSLAGKDPVSIRGDRASAAFVQFFAGVEDINVHAKALVGGAAVG